MNQKIASVLKSVFVIALFAFLVQLVVVYAAPIGGGGVPPSMNVEGPVNVGSTAQVKIGSLHLTGGGFRVFGPALFDDLVAVGTTTPVATNKLTVVGDTYINGNTSIIGTTSITGNALISGNASVNGNVAVGGNINTVGSVTAGNLTGSNGTRPLCASPSGQITFCSGPTVNITSQASAGTCSTQPFTFSSSVSGGTSPYTYLWKIDSVSSGTGSSMSHTFDRPEWTSSHCVAFTTPVTYAISLTVTDQLSNSSIATISITPSVGSPIACNCV